MIAIQWIAIEAIKPNPRNARTHPKKQVRQIADSINAFGFLVPILLDENELIIAGHGRYEAARLLGLKEIPAMRVEGLSVAKRRALALADNKIAANSGWDREILAAELPELADILVVEGLDISITGFAPVEIDQIVTDFEATRQTPLTVLIRIGSTLLPSACAGIFGRWALTGSYAAMHALRTTSATSWATTAPLWRFWIRPTTSASVTSLAAARSSMMSSPWHLANSHALVLSSSSSKV